MNDISMELAAARSSAGQASATRTALYIALVFIAIVAAAYYRLRTDSLFACQAGGYSSDSYLSYCQSNGYGDFDHGAFWFNLEPEATRAAVNAELLFIGNSRMQFALSSPAAETWLAANAPSHFLLGFAYHPRVLFYRALLSRLEPRARVYVINIDSFFEENASVPAQTVMSDPTAPTRYRQKQWWQSAHQSVCMRVSAICGNAYTIFRERRTGSWHASGLPDLNQPTSNEPQADPAAVARQTESGRKFLDALGVDRRCVIFTLTPTVDTPYATSAAVAAALQVDFFAPQMPLTTFDGSHLDGPSAERWSQAFFAAAGQKIRECYVPSPRAS